MRVIHHDGRVGTKSRVHLANSTWVDFDDAPGEWVSVRHLRPLGPIEAELRANPDELSPVPCEAYGVAMDRDPLALSEDIDSELLEACARIWEQHEVSL